MASETQELIWELKRLGARGMVLSTNVELRQDGLPYSNRRRPEDPGVAVMRFEVEAAAAWPSLDEDDTVS